MNNYLNKGGNSNISSYKFGSDHIKVCFNDNSVYLYTYVSAGQQNVEQMKQLAVQGQGLNGFINKFVSKNYASKE
jgi:hypothetical protein